MEGGRVSFPAAGTCKATPYLVPDPPQDLPWIRCTLAMVRVLPPHATDYPAVRSPRIRERRAFFPWSVLEQVCS